MKLKQKVAAVAVKTYYKNINPGITEVEMAGLIEYDVQRMTGRVGDFSFRLLNEDQKQDLKNQITEVNKR